MNLFIDNATKAKVLAAHLFGWKLGLKTGMYYLRTKAATDAIKFTLDKKVVEEPTVNASSEENLAAIACSLENPDACEACSG